MNFSENPVPGYVLQMLLNLSADVHIMVRHTAVVLIGDLAKWIRYHDEFIGLLLTISIIAASVEMFLTCNILLLVEGTT